MPQTGCITVSASLLRLFFNLGGCRRVTTALQSEDLFRFTLIYLRIHYPFRMHLSILNDTVMSHEAFEHIWRFENICEDAQAIHCPFTFWRIPTDTLLIISISIGLLSCDAQFDDLHSHKIAVANIS